MNLEVCSTVFPSDFSGEVRSVFCIVCPSGQSVFLFFLHACLHSICQLKVKVFLLGFAQKSIDARSVIDALLRSTFQMTLDIFKVVFATVRFSWVFFTSVNPHRFTCDFFRRSSGWFLLSVAFVFS